MDPLLECRSWYARIGREQLLPDNKNQVDWLINPTWNTTPLIQIHVSYGCSDTMKAK